MARAADLPARGRTALPPHDVADVGLAPDGRARIAWAGDQMPVLRRIRERFAEQRPVEGVRIAACLHVTAETANLMLALAAGGASPALCSANPLSAQDDVAASLVADHGLQVRAVRGEALETYASHVRSLLSGAPQITIDDGADLLVTAHEQQGGVLEGLIGGTEETTTGLVRLRRLEGAGRLVCPVLAVNEARTERALNDRHGTGQSALDGIVRASNVLLAGLTVVVVGYGATGQGVAERARGAGAAVVVCEVDPLRALEARMAGYDVMPALQAAGHGDVFVTVTGSRRVLRGEHFALMKDGALLANAGHFDVEIDLEELRTVAVGGVRQVRPLIEQFELQDGRRLNLLANGRVVNLAAAEGHPAAVMDVSFALQALCVEELVRRRGEPHVGVHPVPDAIDREVGRLKLEALGVRIDEPTAEQAHYRESGVLGRAGARAPAGAAADAGAQPRSTGPERSERIREMAASTHVGGARGGIDLGGTKIEAVVVDERNEVLGASRHPTPSDGGPSGVAAALTSAVREACDAAGLEPSRLIGIGVGSPGMVDEATGAVSSARNLPDWEGTFELGPALSSALGTPVFVGNDVQVATEAEFQLGAGRPYKSLLGVFWGTGVGGGLVLDGKPWLGRGGAGEIGHMVVKTGGRRCPCGRRGCMEAYAGRAAMEARARAEHAKGKKTDLFKLMAHRGRTRLTSAVWAHALEHGDKLATRLIDEAVEALGAGIASAVNLLDVEAVIIGGGLGVRFGTAFGERIAAEMQPHLFNDSRPPDVMVAALGDIGGALGAALLAARR